MNFRLLNKHIVVDIATNIGTRSCVFDTGSPFSFFFDANVCEYYIGGRTFRVTSNPMVMMVKQHLSTIERMIGINIDGFLGADCFTMLNNVNIDFPNAQIDFEDNMRSENKMSMRDVCGLPIFNVSFNGTSFEAAFDSGAMYSFVTTNVLHTIGLTSSKETIEDFNPMLGNFSASLYEGKIVVGELDLGVQNIASSPAYDQALSMLGVQAFIGIDALKGNGIHLSYNEKTICVY